MLLLVLPVLWWPRVLHRVRREATGLRKAKRTQDMPTAPPVVASLGFSDVVLVVLAVMVAVMLARKLCGSASRRVKSD